MERLTHNVIQLALSTDDLPSPAPATGLCAWHVDVRAAIDGKQVARAYTPLSSREDCNLGRLQLMVKVYSTGLLTPQLANLKAGDMLQVSSPIETLEVSKFKDGLAIVTGGSAVTVALQLCTAMTQQVPDAPVRVVLCFHAMEDIVYLEQFHELQKRSKSLQISLCITQGIKGAKKHPKVIWHHGRINETILSKTGEKETVIVSGPPALCQEVASLLVWLRRANFRLLDAELNTEAHEERMRELSEEARRRRTKSCCFFR